MQMCNQCILVVKYAKLIIADNGIDSIIIFLVINIQQTTDNILFVTHIFWRLLKFTQISLSISYISLSWFWWTRSSPSRDPISKSVNQLSVRSASKFILINALADDSVKKKRGNPESDPRENHAKVPIIISLPFCSFNRAPHLGGIRHLFPRVHSIFSAES